MQSPLLALPGAVAGDGVDAPVAAHYGSFNTEQRTLARGDGFVDLSHRDVVRISGPERLSWLHNLTTQYFDGLAPGTWTQALVLSPSKYCVVRLCSHDSRSGPEMRTTSRWERSTNPSPRASVRCSVLKEP